MRRWWVPAVVTLVVGAGAGAAAGYAAAAHRSNVAVATGAFYVGDHQASAPVDGWEYGVSDGVTWLDARNVWHRRGWPECLAPLGATRTVRFGYTPVEAPMGIAWRQVVWVSCRP